MVPIWKEQDLRLFHQKVEHYRDQFFLTEVFNLSYREIKHLYQFRFFIAHRCDIFESNYDV